MSQPRPQVGTAALTSTSLLAHTCIRAKRPTSTGRRHTLRFATLGFVQRSPRLMDVSMVDDFRQYERGVGTGRILALIQHLLPPLLLAVDPEWDHDLHQLLWYATTWQHSALPCATEHDRGRAHRDVSRWSDDAMQPAECLPRNELRSTQRLGHK